MIEYRTSSFCSFGDCVEVGRLPHGAVSVRDTKDRSKELTVDGEAWARLVGLVKAGELDLV